MSGLRLSNEQVVDDVTQYIEQVQQSLLVPWQGLRADLTLHASTRDETGQATWLLEDLLTGSMYKLGIAQYHLYAALVTTKNLHAALLFYRQNHHHLPQPVEFTEFLSFLQQHKLSRGTHAIDSGGSQSSLTKGLRSVISMRLPLIKPDKLLVTLLPLLAWLWHPFMRGVWLLCGVAGVFLILPQYELYFASAGYLATPNGIMWFAVCLILLKIGHEFAHALVAKQYGLYVPRMGIVLIVFWPVLYTDTTQAWKLQSFRQRLHIDIAGVTYELVVAAVTLLLWALLPDGLLRNLMFYLSSTSIVSSLFINLNPLMRFDGYYILMDLWGIDNLQTRSFDLLKYRLRRWCWDWQGQPPETHSQARKMVWYAWAVMLYRVMLSVVIAAAIYYLVHPWLGIVAWCYVVVIMILAPVFVELKTVAAQRQLMGRSWRKLLGIAVPFAVLALLFIPFRAPYYAPALVVLADAEHIVAPGNAKLTSTLPKQGSIVVQGDVLASMSNPELDFQVQEAQLNMARLAAEINRLGTSGEQGAYRQWLQADQQRQQAKLEKLQLAQQQLVIRARYNGVVMKVSQTVRSGDHLAKDTALLTIANPDTWEVHAYVHEQQLGCVQPLLGQATLSIPKIDSTNSQLLFKYQQTVAATNFANESLFDVYGGPIASKKEEEQLRPRQSWYQVAYQLRQAPKQLRHGLPAEVALGTGRESIAMGWYKRITSMLAADGVL